jgi:hypothetical protein
MASNLLPKRIVQSLGQGKKNFLQFNSNLSRYVFSKRVFLGKKDVTHENNVKVFGQTLHVTKPTPCVQQYLSPKKANLKNIKGLQQFFESLGKSN